MKKSMYSLILSEGVVAEIDRLAYEAKTNRSQMINSILAEYVSYRTPEMRIREMFRIMEGLLEPSGGFRIMLRSSDSSLGLRSALAYKYNPTIQYSVELYRMPSDAVGEIKAGLRTQNSSLKLYLLQFYKLWGKLESSSPGGACAMDGERFIKRLVPHYSGHGGGHISEEELSGAIVDYICAFDRALKAFFYNLDNAPEAVAQAERSYQNYRAGSHIVM